LLKIFFIIGFAKDLCSKMERSSDNKNQGMQNQEVIIFIIEIEM
jgi:hypothetical protein